VAQNLLRRNAAQKQNKSALDIRTNVLYRGFISEKADFVPSIEQVRHAPLRINRAFYTFLVYAAPPLGRVGNCQVFLV
jgi:hypothetical protein